MKLLVSFHMKDGTIRSKVFEDTQETITRPATYSENQSSGYIFNNYGSVTRTTRLIEQVITNSAHEKFHDYMQLRNFVFEEGRAKIFYSAEALNFYSYVEVTDDFETSSDESSI